MRAFADPGRAPPALTPSSVAWTISDVKRFFLSFFGCLAALFAVALALAGGAFIFQEFQKQAIKEGSYLVLRMTGGLMEYDPPNGPMGRLTGQDPETLQRILTNLEKAAVDDRIRGVVVFVAHSAAVGVASTEEIRSALKRVRAAGKKVVGWAESFDEQDYLLLSVCEDVFAPPLAYISFSGFSSRTMHLKEALSKVGVEPNVSQIRAYKSAAELVTRSDMSEEARENRTWLLDERWSMFVEALGRDRKLDEAKITALMNHALFTAAEAQEMGLLDGVTYWDELEIWLKNGQYPEENRLRTVSSSRYAEEDPGSLGLQGKKTIAVVHAQGLISGRENGTDPLFGLTMGHESIVRELRRARLDDDVAAIVFRVDTRGGDSLASDLIGREVELTATKKPVVVSMVDYGTSGGYAISYRATKVLANAGTLTGSIGSISAKFNVKAFYDRLGVTYDGVTKGPMARFFSDLRDFTDEERTRFEENHEAGFMHWLKDVAEHRDLKLEDLEKLAYGRVWTGRQAVQNGLIDELGDFQSALKLAQELAKISANERVTVRHLPEQMSLVESILDDADPLSAAARWVAYRAIRSEVAAMREALAAEMAAER